MKICMTSPLGGHLDELLRLKEAFEGHDYFYVTYRSQVTENLENVYLINLYKESTINLMLLFIVTTLRATSIIIKERPDVVISSGGLLSVPFSYLGKISGAKIIYIECSARVTSASRAGKIVYPISDLFLVQWESLLKNYGKKAKYVRGFF